MTLRHLQIFVTVCQEGSTTAAANKLFIAQSAVSTYIKEMEKHYNRNLFERFSRRLHITKFGEQVYDYAVRILSLYEEMNFSLDAMRTASVLRIGTGTAIGKLFMPKVIKSYSIKNPSVKTYLTVEAGDAIAEKLLGNKLDFAIMEGIKDEPAISHYMLQSGSIVAICNKDHPLAKKKQKTVTAKDFAGVNLLLRETGSMTRHAVDQFFSNHNMTVEPVWESTSVMSLINAVVENLGVSFLSLNHVLAANRPEITILNVEGFNAERFVNVYYHKDKRFTPEMLDFIEHFRIVTSSMRNSLDFEASV